MLVERGSTDMLSIRALAMISVLAIGVTGAAVNSGYSNDDDVYDQLVTIKGSVQILNHPELGKTAGSGMAIIFQRADCKRCIITAVTDKDGKYEVRVGRGRYKVIAREGRGGGAPSFDLLAPDQPRYVDAYSLLPEGNRFDIKLVLPAKR
jgi:hypothetical protein